MNGRVTPKGSTPEPDELPSLKERNPMMWWIAVITVIALVIGTMGSALLLVLF